VWCERFASTGDFQYTRQRVLSELREHTRLVSLNQLAYCPDDPVPAGQMLGQFVKQSWQEMIDLAIDRLLTNWETITMEEIGHTDTDHVYGFRCAFTPDDLLTAVIERYEVAADSDYHVVRAPAVVIRWLAGEHEHDVVIKDPTDYPSTVDDLTVQTALTLFERGANTYSSIDEALSAAKRL
jgi:hypothetical protein